MKIQYAGFLKVFLFSRSGVTLESQSVSKQIMEALIILVKYFSKCKRK